MSETAVQPISGTYRAQPEPSTFEFAVRHTGVFRYRGSMSDVTASLEAHDDAIELAGSALVESISVTEPAAMRESVLGPAFFDAQNHPEVSFRSTSVRLSDDGSVEVDGDLTIRGVTCPVAAAGRFAGPQPAPFGEAVGFQLQTTFDRREFGFDWQMELPGGGNAVGWDVDLDIDLLFLKEA